MVEQSHCHRPQPSPKAFGIRQGLLNIPNTKQIRSFNLSEGIDSDLLKLTFRRDCNILSEEIHGGWFWPPAVLNHDSIRCDMFVPSKKGETILRPRRITGFLHWSLGDANKHQTTTSCVHVVQVPPFSGGGMYPKCKLHFSNCFEGGLEDY